MPTKMIICSVVAIAFPVMAWCQVYSMSYAGPPRIISIDSVRASNGDTLIFKFCTESVPDRLTVYLQDTLTFYIGNNIATNTSLNEYHGFCDFFYDGWLDIMQTNGQGISNFGCDSKSGGQMRLTVINRDRCYVKFRVDGNSDMNTVYDLLIYRKKFTPDTIEIPVCKYRNPYDSVINCHNYHIISVDSSQFDYTVTYPTCESEGYIEFPDYPQFNQPIGFNGSIIEVSNSVCRDTVTITVDQYPCEVYIPNAFHPNSENNGNFIVYSDVDISYRIRIYNRWGGLIHDGEYITNNGGWDGGKYQSGVYVYIIILNDIQYVGSLTLIK